MWFLLRKNNALSLAFILILAGMFSNLFAVDSAEQVGKFYTLEECMKRAKSNYKAVEIANYRIQGAKAQKQEMRAALLPQVTLDGVWDNSNHALSGDLTQFQKFHSNHALGISIQQGLWDFGASLKRLRASDFRKEAIEMEKKSVILELEELVKSSYLKVLEKEKIINVLQSSIETLKQQLKNSNDLYEQGIVISSDVLSVEVQLSEKEKKVLQAKNELIEARMFLNRLVGLPLNEKITLEDVDLKLCQYRFEDLLAQALCHRPDLLALKKRMQSLRLEKQAVRIGIAPQFYAFANGNYSSEKSAISAGIGMKMPLYEGGKSGAKANQLSASYQELNATLEDLIVLVELEIKKNYLQLEEALQSIQMDQKSESLAEENLKKTIDLYEQGLIPIHNVLLVEEQLSFVRMNVCSNIYRYHLILAHLIRIAGVEEA